MAPDVKLQSFDAVVLDDEPQFERAEASAEGHVPVAIIEDRARLSGLVAQIFRRYAQAVRQRLAVSDVEAGAVEIGEHPFVRVEAVAVGELQSVLDVTKLGT